MCDLIRRPDEHPAIPDSPQQVARRSGRRYARNDPFRGIGTEIMNTPDASLVVPSGDDAANLLSSEFQRGWWRRLQALVDERLRTERDSAEQYRTESAAIERLFVNDQRERSETYDRERTALQAEFDKTVIDAGATYSEDYSIAKEEFDEVLDELQQRAGDEVDAAERKHEEDQWVVVSYFDEEAEGSPKQQYRFCLLAGRHRPQ